MDFKHYFDDDDDITCPIPTTPSMIQEKFPDVESVIAHFEINDELVAEDFSPDPYQFEHECEEGIPVDSGPIRDFQYEDCSQRYLILEEDKEKLRQFGFFDYYHMRVSHFQSQILDSAKEILGDSVEAVTVDEIEPDKKCLVIGCLLKHGERIVRKSKSKKSDTDTQLMMLKTPVFDEIEIFDPDTDEYDLLDIKKQLITLKGIVKKYKNSTGLAFGVYGTLINEREFDVEKFIIPCLPPYIERPLIEEDVYVIFVSGIDLNNTCPIMIREFNGFSEILNSEDYYNKIARMIFSGCDSANTCGCVKCDPPVDLKENGSFVISLFHRYFPHVDIDVMPSHEKGAVISSFPQQPIPQDSFYEFYKTFHFGEEDGETEYWERKTQIKSEILEFENLDDVKPLESPFSVKEEIKDEEDSISESVTEIPISSQDSESTFLAEPNQPINFAEVRDINESSQSSSDSQEVCDTENAAFTEDISPQSNNIYEPPVDSNESLQFHQDTQKTEPSLHYCSFAISYFKSLGIACDSEESSEEEEEYDPFAKEHIRDEYALATDYWLLDRLGRNPSNTRSINAVTNPYCFKIMGTEIHGTSGQNVDAFRKLTKKGKSTLEIMKDIIKSGIVVPTAPDFTDCFPFNRQDGIDPLALERLPHVFFAGNQKEFATEMADFGDGRMIRLISIPKFDESHSMILINLKNLQVSRIKQTRIIKKPPRSVPVVKPVGRIRIKKIIIDKEIPVT